MDTLVERCLDAIADNIVAFIKLGPVIAMLALLPVLFWFMTKGE